MVRPEAAAVSNRVAYSSRVRRAFECKILAIKVEIGARGGLVGIKLVSSRQVTTDTCLIVYTPGPETVIEALLDISAKITSHCRGKSATWYIFLLSMIEIQRASPCI